MAELPLQADISDAAAQLVRLSPVLARAAVHADVHAALSAVQQAAIEVPPLPLAPSAHCADVFGCLQERVGPRQLAVEAVRDSGAVLRRGDFVLMALADAHHIVQQAAVSAVCASPSISDGCVQAECKRGDKRWAGQLALHGKKLWFLLVWAHEQPPSAWAPLAAACQAEHLLRSEQMRASPPPPSAAPLATAQPRKPLIQEL